MENTITKSKVFKFNDRTLAFNFAYGPGARGFSMVILGDDEKFWVCSMADAERLLRAGYEKAR